jgi:Flp pilus assembly protein TadG
MRAFPMTSFFERLRRFVGVFRADTSGIILPYVTLLLVVFVGLGALALDGGRYMSMSTQMQEVADSLALAGARELNGQAGARARATNAINSMVSNGLTGLGYTGTISNASPVFFSALPAANSGFTGTAATSDYDARFVAVTVNPVTIPTVMPIGFFKAGAASSFSTGGRAIAGFKNRAVCGVSPVFVCNPYETSGMSDSQATAALYAALDPTDPSYDPTTRRKLFRMPGTNNNTSPGHFGWLQFANNFDGCNPNSTPCLNKLVAYDDSSLSRMCVDGSGVQLATGNKPVPDAFNDRFDIYSGNGPSTQFTPSINVRKGYTAGSGNQCNASAGDSLSQQNNVGFSLASASTTLAAAATKNATSISVASITGIQNGMSIITGSGATAVVQGTVSAVPAGTTVTTTKLANAITSGTQLTFSWLTAALPLDQNWTAVCGSGPCAEGDGNWDCLSYWNINHSTAAPPSGCTSSNPTLSRYDVYNYENSQAGNSSANAPITDYSGLPRGTSSNGESGAPFCAASKGFTPTFNAKYDPRMVNVAVINCSAQTALGNIGGGNSGPLTPVAGFAQFFLTQPYNSDGQNYLYGEMTGLINSLNSNRILNQVQLYR